MKLGYRCLLLIILLGSQGCFEVVEQINMHLNGTGDIVLTANFSQSKTKLNGIMKMKTINGRQVPTKQTITNKLKEIQTSAANTIGITNANLSSDFENYIFTFSCNFSKIEQLNTVIKNIAESQKSKAKISEKIYSYQLPNLTFNRFNKYNVKKDYQKMSNADKEIFATANYTAIYKFDTPITSLSNTDASLSASKKACMLKQNVLAVILEKKSIENTITLKK